MEEFSLGFGKKLFGFTDKKGTIWKFCLLPFGGYVKMFGDRNSASAPDNEAFTKMTDEEKNKSFLGKNVYQKIAIVFAGPAANFLLAIVFLTALFRINGFNILLPIVDQVLPESAAFEANLKSGDEIIAIDGKEISNFDQVREAISQSFGEELVFRIKRENEVFEKKIAPKIQLRKDFFGEDVKLPTLGIAVSKTISQELNLLQSFKKANLETYHISCSILRTIGELIVGKRSVEELGGPIKIAKYSGQTVDMGIIAVIWFIAMISINLGVMNLLPIPVLDGGHLFFYLIQVITRKKISQKTQQVAFNIGLALVLTLMIFTTFNDLKSLFK